MAAIDVLGTVCDRLVGGLMFHSEHADLCRFLGLRGLAELHEEGFAHDTECMRRVRSLAIDHLGCMVPEGRQERGRTLDAFRGTRRWDVGPEARATALGNAMQAWVDWEDDTVSVLTGACDRLYDAGELLLSDEVRQMAKETSEELSHARDLMVEMRSVGWDMSHVLQMDY